MTDKSNIVDHPRRIKLIQDDTAAAQNRMQNRAHDQARASLPLIDAAIEVVLAAAKCNVTSIDGGLLLQNSINQLQRVLRETP